MILDLNIPIRILSTLQQRFQGFSFKCSALGTAPAETSPEAKGSHQKKSPEIGKVFSILE
jgi:hypothetical protein